MERRVVITEYRDDLYSSAIPLWRYTLHCTDRSSLLPITLFNTDTLDASRPTHSPRLRLRPTWAKSPRLDRTSQLVTAMATWRWTTAVGRWRCVTSTKSGSCLAPCL